jgi:outer membrane protein OmpA-like peptidoglycan-associated protein
MQLWSAMKTSIFASVLFAALAISGCSKDQQPDTLPASALAPPPPAPEFEEQAKLAAPTPAPASESARPIAPDDQIHFALDSDDLGDRERAMLDQIAAWARNHPEREVVVQGHADASGSAAHNVELSARRAQAVGSYVKARGVTDAQLIIAAQGEEKAGLAPAAANRRVSIFAT